MSEVVSLTAWLVPHAIMAPDLVSVPNSITKLVRARSCHGFPRMARYVAVWPIEVQLATSCRMLQRL